MQIIRGIRRGLLPNFLLEVGLAEAKSVWSELYAVSSENFQDWRELLWKVCSNRTTC